MTVTRCWKSSVWACIKDLLTSLIIFKTMITILIKVLILLLRIYILRKLSFLVIIGRNKGNYTQKKSEYQTKTGNYTQKP
jgi:hypothetical protein